MTPISDYCQEKKKTTKLYCFSTGVAASPTNLFFINTSLGEAAKPMKKQ